jgi:hypothetical protein
LKADPKLISEILKHEVTEQDVVAIGYRRSQLTRFRSLMEDPAHFAREKA